MRVRGAVGGIRLQSQARLPLQRSAASVPGGGNLKEPVKSAEEPARVAAAVTGAGGASANSGDSTSGAARVGASTKTAAKGSAAGVGGGASPAQTEARLDVKLSEVPVPGGGDGGSGGSGSARAAKVLGFAAVGAAGLYGAYSYKQLQDERQRREQQEAERQRKRAAAREEEERRRIEAEQAKAQAIREAKAAEAAAERKRREEAARKCRPAIVALEASLLAASSPATSAEATEALEAAVAQAKSAVKGAPLDNATAASASSLLEQAVNRLKDIELAVQEQAVFSEALQSAANAEDVDACRSAFAEAERAEAVLSKLQEDSRIAESANADPNDSGVVLRDLARARLERLEEEERQAIRRAEALGQLKDAIDKRKPGVCGEALANAREVGLEPCAAMCVAEVLSETSEPPPQVLMATQIADRLAQLTGGGRIGTAASGLTVEDFAAAEAFASESMNVEQLRDRAVELACALVTSYEAQAHRVKDEVELLEGDFFRMCAQRAEQAVQNFEAEHNRCAEARKEEMREEYRRLTEQSQEETIAHVADQGAMFQAALAEAADRIAANRLEEARQILNQRVDNIGASLDALDTLYGENHSPWHRVAASKTLSKGGSHAAAAAADEFAACVIDTLPREVAKGSPALSTQELAHSFKAELGSFAAAAFSPPSQGLLSSILSGAVGRVFSLFYVIPGAHPPGRAEAHAEDTATVDASAVAQEAVWRNLASLSRAARFMEGGEVNGALADLEASLSGACRARAATWMEQARRTLLLQQMARVLEARSRCLTTVLAPASPLSES
eukprot:TRINITY_DN20140_c0_g1_i1.p1 TRINITY_DN20140_c0_g1~~TRINITY_DN20140_c0_g1_i1.p1  ORF type:complete len:793 (-),score=229.76 TRINITY_DN20140_c0_g1_i1:58-2436(-)